MGKKEEIADRKRQAEELIQEALDCGYRSTLINTALLQELVRDLEEAQEYIDRMEPTICWGVECVHTAKALDMVSEYDLKLKEDIREMMELIKDKLNGNNS